MNRLAEPRPIDKKVNYGIFPHVQSVKGIRTVRSPMAGKKKPPQNELEEKI
jgi:hypothetical protein